MKIAVLGAGAMGSLIGAFLKKSGEDVLLIDPYHEHMEKIRTCGLELHLNDQIEYVRMDTAEGPDEADEADLVVVLVKGMYTRDALKKAGGLIGPETYLLTLQNGLGNDNILAEFVPEDHVLKGVMKIASQMKGPGVIASRTMKNVTAVYLGCRRITKEAASMARILEKDFTAAGIQAEYEDNIDFYIWSKAVNNISLNTACAIARLTIRDFLGNPDGKELLKKCVDEVTTIANAKGIPLRTETVLDTIYTNTLPKIGGHLPSTAQDVREKKRTEVDFLNGAIVRMGNELGIETPVNDVITGFLKVIEQNYDKMF